MLRLAGLRVFACAATLLLVQSASIKSTDNHSHEHNHNFQRANDTVTSGLNPNESQGFQRRQDGGFDFMNYFLNGNSQQQQQNEHVAAPQQLQQAQQPLTVQQQHQLQRLILQQQQQRQQEQLLQLQQQQLLQQQQQHQPRGVNYQENSIQQYPDQAAVLHRDGGIGIGTGYSQGGGYAAHPKEIGITIGGGKPVLQVGKILTLLPRIVKVLSAGGKVMFGVELGNNFYFGPVGAKPLGKAVLG